MIAGEEITVGSKLVVLMVGLGSIGQRHLRNLRHLLRDQVDILAYRQRGQSPVLNPDMTIREGADLETTYNIRSFSNLDEALAEKPDAVFITNPNTLHVPTALAAARAGCHLFIEKPISHTLDGVDELRRVVATNKLTVQVGFQFRFHPGLQRVKVLIDEGTVGRVVSVQAHWGEHLGDWHPWEDYRQSYSARSDLGGGVLLTLCHPFDYLRWLIGQVREVSAMVGHIGGLDIPVEDTADVHLRFASGVIGHVHLDYLQRPPSHWLQVAGQQGTLRWDSADGIARCYRSDADQWEAFPIPESFNRNTLFIDEMHHFLACIEGSDEPRCTLEDGIQALRIALAAKRATAERRMIPL